MSTCEELKKQSVMWAAIVTVGLILLMVALWWFMYLPSEIGQADYEALAAIKTRTGQAVRNEINQAMQDGHVSEKEYTVICAMHLEWRQQSAKARLRP